MNEKIEKIANDYIKVKKKDFLYDMARCATDIVKEKLQNNDNIGKEKLIELFHKAFCNLDLNKKSEQEEYYKNINWMADNGFIKYKDFGLQYVNTNLQFNKLYNYQIWGESLDRIKLIKEYYDGKISEDELENEFIRPEFIKTRR